MTAHSVPGSSLWNLVTTPLTAIHTLRQEYGFETLGQLCELTEDDLDDMLDRHGIMGVKRDLAFNGLTLADRHLD